MARKSKPAASTYSITVPNGVYGQPVTAQVTPVPVTGLWVHFDIRGQDGGVAINWVRIDAQGSASQVVSSPTYQGGPGSGTAFVGDGFTLTPLSNVASFEVTA